MNKDTFVNVTIFGNEYRVRGEANEDEIREIARYVDGLMRDISMSGRHASEARVAILAAFNIAAELYHVKRSEAVEGDSEEKAAMLLEMLSDELMVEVNEDDDASA